jgi:hypothetical protein
MNNEIKINVPEGMEIDKENSTFECIKFKPKWTPKRGDIATTGSMQIILVGECSRKDYVGFDVKSLAVLNTCGNRLTIWNSTEPLLWVKSEASASEKELFIEKLNEQGYIYDPNDPRVIYKKEKELPKTWEEFCENNPIQDNEVFITNESEIVDADFASSNRNYVVDKNLLPSEEYAEAMLALCQLIQLRDCYNDGWEPDWNDGEEEKYVIIHFEKEIGFSTNFYESRVLTFKTRELREEFYNNFLDLIEQAKLLL